MARTPEPTLDHAIDDCLSTALRQATRRIGAFYDTAMAPLGINGTQARLLWKIGQFQSEKGAALGQVAREMGYQVSALSHAVKPLERDGLLRVVQDRADRRVRRLELTAQGQQVVAKVLARWEAANAQVEAVLGREETEGLLRLATRLAAAEFGQPSKPG